MTLETIILIAAFVALVGLITYAMIRTLRRNDQLIEYWNLNSQELKALLKQHQQIGDVFNKIEQPIPNFNKGCNDAPSGYDKFEHPYLHLDVDNYVKAWVDVHKPITEEQAMNNAKLFLDMGVLLEKYMCYINHIEGTTYTADYLMCEYPQRFTVEEQHILREIRNKINSEA